MQRICSAIRKLLDRMAYVTVFNHLDRTRNIAGLLLEQRRRKEEERRLSHLYEKTFMMSSSSSLQELLARGMATTTA
jgi:hypothetical protein